MKRITITGAVLLGIVLAIFNLQAEPCVKLPVGETEVLYTFVDPNPAYSASPEGIAFDSTGNMFITLRTYGAGVILTNEILRISPTGEETILADMGPAFPGAFGALGLETDPMGNVYVAMASYNENHGVWKIYPDGTAEHLPGSENIFFPDGLTMDRKGNLYATDADPTPFGNGGVWKYDPKEGNFVLWLNHPLLVPAGPDPDGNPAVGANGIVFDPPNHLYVTNTQQSLLLHIDVMPDGSPGEVSIVAGGPPLLNPDGLTLDANGNVYATIPISTFPSEVAAYYGLPPLSPVIRIIPDTGELQPVLDPVNFPDLEYFDFPTSLAFGRGPRDHKSVFVVSMGAASYGFPFGTVPTLTQVGVGIPGKAGR